MEIICKICRGTFTRFPSVAKRYKESYCSKKCLGIANSISLIGNRNGFKKGHIPYTKGLLGFQSDESSPHWKGDNVGYRGIHRWINKKLGKLGTCEHCSKSGLSGHSIHWANKSREYKRELTDWLRLCVKCHKAYDKSLIHSY